MGGQSVQGATQRDKVWTKYVDMLKYYLTESKEFMALITPNQDTLMREMQEDCQTNEESHDTKHKTHGHAGK